MSTQDLYKQTTFNLSDTFSKLQVLDPLLTNELEVIRKIIERTPRNAIKNLTYGPLPIIPREQIVFLVTEFLYKCSPDYADRFITDLVDGKIVFTSSIDGSYIHTNPKTGQYKIYIDETNTIDDAISLVHEYFHSLNINDYVYRQAFSDSVSISAEFLFLEFLQEKGISTYDISLASNRRNDIFVGNTDYLRKLLPLYIETANGNEINDETYEKYSNSYSSKEDFLYFINSQIATCNDREARILIYRHCLGYIAASVFHQSGHTPISLAIANNTLQSCTIEAFNLILGNGIFNNESSSYVSDELNHFSNKIYTKK